MIMCALFTLLLSVRVRSHWQDEADTLWLYKIFEDMHIHNLRVLMFLCL